MVRCKAEVSSVRSSSVCSDKGLTLEISALHQNVWQEAYHIIPFLLKTYLDY